MRVPRSFHARDTRVVARELLGKVLIVGGPPGRRARIVETEAYHGFDDTASHAFGGPTRRSAIMFGPPGFAYVYLVYGVWSCLNVVTGPEGFPSAVLLRAAQLLGEPDARTASGPGKLCRALAIDRSWNGEDLVHGTRLWLEDDGHVAQHVRTGRRIGVDYAGAWAARPWRYWIGSHPAVSKEEKRDGPSRPPRRRARERS
jgi:DNA-3-methyladenine glycosylase